MIVTEGYVTDSRGQRIAVMLDIKEYEHLLEDLEELESIRAYDAAKASNEPAIPISVALREIEQI